MNNILEKITNSFFEIVSSVPCKNFTADLNFFLCFKLWATY